MALADRARASTRPWSRRKRREKEARERALRIRHSFAIVAEAFIADKLATGAQRQGGRARPAHHLRRGMGRAAQSARSPQLDVLEIINAKKRTAPQMARALLVLIKRFFNWVLDQHIYGLTASPCDRLKRERSSSASCSRATDASPTPSCSRSGEPPGG